MKTMTNKDNTALTEDLHKVLIKTTAKHADMLLTYSRNSGLTPQQTLFSMVLCAAMLAHTLEIDEGTVCAGIHAALLDLQQ